MRHKYENTDLYKKVERNIRRELDLKLRTRATLNSQRRTKQMPTISVFGYTNVGKTSFIKALTSDTKMQPQNKLFATLDVTYHGSKLSHSNQDIIFIDTIGFISDIPHNLVEAFRTSLQDAIHADLIIHLIDASHPDRLAQESTVDEILADLLGHDRNKLHNVIKVYNKCDKVGGGGVVGEEGSYFVSCMSGEGLAEMRSLIEERVCREKGFIRLKLVIGQGSAEMAFLYKNAVVEEVCGNAEDGQMADMSVLINRVNALKFIRLFPEVRISK
jgi:GTP-binding protein HflX